MRAAFCGILTLEWIILIYNTDDFKGTLKYFTIWGLIYSTVAMFLAFFQCNWRLYSIIYQQALTSELIITPFFYLILRGAIPAKMIDTPLKVLAMYMDHTLPLLCLMTDFIFFSSVPFCRIHVWVMFFFSLSST